MVPPWCQLYRSPRRSFQSQTYSHRYKLGTHARNMLTRTHTLTYTRHHTIIKIMPSGTKIVFGDAAAEGSDRTSGRSGGSVGSGGGATRSNSSGGGSNGVSATAPNVHPSWAAKMVRSCQTSHTAALVHAAPTGLILQSFFLPVDQCTGATGEGRSCAEREKNHLRCR